MWPIAVSGAKQLRFRLKRDKCGRGLRFRDGLAWTAGLTVEKKLSVRIPLAWCGPLFFLSFIVFKLQSISVRASSHLLNL